MTGWNLPPGVSVSDIPGNEPDRPCEVCGYDLDHCVCPDCPVCKSMGDPDCYVRGHHIKRYTKAQLIGRAKRRVAELEVQVSEEQLHIAWLKAQPDDYEEDVS